MLPSFTIFGRTIGTYGVCAMLGLLVAAAVAVYLGRRYRMAIDDIIILLLVAGGGLLVGGHLLYAITNYRLVITLFSRIGEIPFSLFVRGLMSIFGGNVFYGGMLGAALAVYIYGRVAKTRTPAECLDIFGVTAPLFHVFGRIGCFLGGCCYGVECSVGFTAHGNTLVPAVNDVCRFPVSLLEAGCNLLIFLFLLWCFTGKKCTGRLFPLYLLLYAPIRFADEFLRGDLIRGIFFGLSTSQWISMIILVSLAVWYIRTRRKTE